MDARVEISASASACVQDGTEVGNPYRSPWRTLRPDADKISEHAKFTM